MKPHKENSNHVEQLLKAMKIHKYNGCLIYEDNGLFYFNRKPYSSLLAAQRHIDKLNAVIEKSIR